MILVVGYGNIMRCDDAAGIFVVQKISEEKIPQVKTTTAHQLHVEMLEEAVGCDTVILVDAAEEGEELVFRKVERFPSSQMVSSHHMTPELFLELARTIYHADLNLYLCSIRGEYFETGATLSSQVLLRVQKAAGLIRNFIVKESAYA